MFWFSVFFFKTLCFISFCWHYHFPSPSQPDGTELSAIKVSISSFPPPHPPTPWGSSIPFGFQAWSTHLTEVTSHLSVTKSSGYFSTFDVIDCAVFLKYYFILPLTSWFSLTSQTESHRYLNRYNSQNWIHNVTFLTYFFSYYFTSFSSVSQSGT